MKLILVLLACVAVTAFAALDKDTEEAIKKEVKAQLAAAQKAQENKGKEEANKVKDANRRQASIGKLPEGHVELLDEIIAAFSPKGAELKDIQKKVNDLIGAENKKRSG